MLRLKRPFVVRQVRRRSRTLLCLSLDGGAARLLGEMTETGTPSVDLALDCRDLTSKRLAFLHVS